MADWHSLDPEREKPGSGFVGSCFSVKDRACVTRANGFCGLGIPEFFGGWRDGIQLHLLAEFSASPVAEFSARARMGLAAKFSPTPRTRRNGCNGVWTMNATLTPNTTVAAELTLNTSALYTMATPAQREALDADYAAACHAGCDDADRVAYLDMLAGYPNAAAYLSSLSGGNPDVDGTDTPIVDAMLDHVARIGGSVEVPEADEVLDTDDDAEEEVPEEEVKDTQAASRAKKCGERAGRRLFGAEARLTKSRYDAGCQVQTFLLGERAKVASGWVKERAGLVLLVEAGVERESGIVTTVNALVGTSQVIGVLAELADMDVATWCKGVAWTAARELVPLVERDADTDTWSLIPGVVAEATALAKQVTSGRLTAKWCADKCRQIVGLSLSRKAEQARALADTLGQTPADKAQATLLLKQANADDKRATKLLSPPAEKKTAKPSTAKPTAGEVDMDTFETTVENLAGYGEGDAASADCRASHAWTLLSADVSGLQAFAGILDRESQDAEAPYHAVDVLLTELFRLRPAAMRRIVARLEKSAK